MAYATATLTIATDNYLIFLNTLIEYITGLSEPTFTGTGTGDIHNIRISNTAVSETWTIALTSASAFTVTGSVSGAQAAGTVGVAYSNSLIEFIILDGPTAFVATDEFEVVVTANTFNTSGQQWMMNGSRSQASTPGLNRFRRFVALKGFGLAGADALYCNLWAYENTTDPFFNIGKRGAISFNAAQWTDGTLGRTDDLDFSRMIDLQADTSESVYTPMHNGEITYWINVDGRYVVYFAKLDTRYQSGCFGFFLPYGTPLQYPYPLMVGGSSQTSNTLLSSTDEDHSQFWDPGDGCTQVRCADGTWRSFEHYGTTNRERNVYPWATAQTSNGAAILTNLNANIDGSYTLLAPVLHMDTPFDDVLGEIPKIKYVSGFGNSSENTITDGGDTYVCFQNIFRISNTDFVALITA